MTRLPPAEKLPLATRKDIRDEWDNKKEEWEKKISDILGETWTITVDPKAIYPYAAEGDWARNSTGSVIAKYIEGAEYQLKYFTDKYGDEGKKEINSTATAHNITIDFDEAKKNYYCGCEISPSGDLVILFSEGNLGVNINDALSMEKLEKALNDSPTNTDSGKELSYYARGSLAEEWKPKIDEVQKKLNEILGKEVPIQPDFNAIFAKMKSTPNSATEWEKNFGYYLIRYFEALNDYLKYEKFDSDDMLQETLVEAIEGNSVQFRVLDKINKYYNETVIEDGILYLQTTPDNFGVNISQIADKLIDLL